MTYTTDENRMTRDDDISEKYDRKLETFVADNPDVSREAAEEAFREHCQTFRETLKEDAPRETIRSLAFDKLVWNPPGEE